jgi:hypothetical protein
LRAGAEKKITTYLDELVPASGNDDGVLGVRAEAHARNPLGVTLVGDGVLAVAEGVPELDGSVAGAGNDLTVVGGEGDGEDVVGVANEATGRHTGGELPETEGLVPGRGESVGTVGGDDLCTQCQPQAFQPSQFLLLGDSTYAVGDDVRVAVKASLGVSVRSLVACQVPDDEGLVSRRGKEHVRAGRASVGCLRRLLASIFELLFHHDAALQKIGNILLEGGSQGRNPARVALKGTTENQLLGHDCVEWLKLEKDFGRTR